MRRPNAAVSLLIAPFYTLHHPDTHTYTRFLSLYSIYSFSLSSCSSQKPFLQARFPPLSFSLSSLSIFFLLFLSLSTRKLTPFSTLFLLCVMKVVCISSIYLFLYLVSLSLSQEYYIPLPESLSLSHLMRERV